MRKILVLVTVLILTHTVFLVASDTTVSFTIAPPPVGYPIFTKGTSTMHFGGNAVFMSMDFQTESLNIVGGSVFGNYQKCYSDNFSLSSSFGLGFMAGNQFDMKILQIPVGANAIYSAYKNEKLSLFLFGGVRSDIAFNFMTITVPQLVNITLVNDETTMTTTSIMATVNIGAQLNITSGSFVFSPYGIYNHTSGTFSSSQTSSMSFTYPTYTGDIEGYSSIIFGIDVLYVPKNISLSSYAQISDDTNIFSLAFKKLLNIR